MGRDAGARWWRAAAGASLLAALGCSALLGVESPSRRGDDAVPDAAPDAAPCVTETCLGCAPDERACGGRCVAFDDPLHCGACSRSCQGGTCVEGHCGPVVLASALGVVRSLANWRDALFVVSITTTANLMRIPKEALPCLGTDDRCVVQVSSAPIGGADDAGDGRFPWSLGLNDLYLYVAFANRGVVRSPWMASEGGTAGAFEAFTTFVNFKPQLVGTPSTLYAVGGGADWASRISSAGTHPLATALGGVPRVRTAVPFGPDALAVWVEDAQGSDVPSGLHIVKTTANTAACAGDTCLHLAGTLLGLGAFAPGAARDDLAVAWQTSRNTASVGIVAAGLTGCGPPGCPQALVTELPTLNGDLVRHVPVVADADYLYWAVNDDEPRGLYRTRLDAPCGVFSPERCERLFPARQILALVQDEVTLFALVASEEGLTELVKVTK